MSDKIDPLLEFYNKAAQGYSHRILSQGYFLPAQMAEFLRMYDVEPQKILDCGAGSGLLGYALKKEWAKVQVTAIDYSEAMLAEAIKGKCFDEAVVYDLREKNWPVGKEYDVVAAASVLEHMPDSFAIEAASHVKENGYLMMSYWPSEISEVRYDENNIPHYCRTSKDIEKLFDQSGIRKLEDETVPAYLKHNYYMNVFLGQKPG